MQPPLPASRRPGHPAAAPPSRHPAQRAGRGLRPPVAAAASQGAVSAPVAVEASTRPPPRANQRPRAPEPEPARRQPPPTPAGSLPHPPASELASHWPPRLASGGPSARDATRTRRQPHQHPNPPSAAPRLAGSRLPHQLLPAPAAAAARRQPPAPKTVTTPATAAAASHRKPPTMLALGNKEKRGSPSLTAEARGSHNRCAALRPPYTTSLYSHGYRAAPIAVAAVSTCDSR